MLRYSEEGRYQLQLDLLTKLLWKSENQAEHERLVGSAKLNIGKSETIDWENNKAKSQIRKNLIEFKGFFFLLFYHFYIYLPVYTPFGPPPLHRHLAFPGRTCSAIFLRFCWRENIGNNKKDIAFLLVWDKDSYTERFS
jgi:hypothetical protein